MSIAASPDSRALEFLRWTEEAGALRLEPFPGGTVLVHPRFPLVWDANHVRLDGPWHGSPDELHAEVERASAGAGLAHPMVAVADEAEADRLAPGLAEHGYRRYERVVMALGRDPDRRAAVPAEDVPVAAVAGLRAAIVRETAGADDEAVGQVLAWERFLAESLEDRWLAAFVEGAPAACARVLSADGVGQVDDVATLPGLRGRGLAASVVLEGVARLRAEGVEMVLIVADADGGPRELYSKLGFDPLTRTSRFHRSAG